MNSLYKKIRYNKDIIIYKYKNMNVIIYNELFHYLESFIIKSHSLIY